MDRVGSGVWDNGTGVGNEGVDDGSETGIGGWRMNEAASVAAVPVSVFAAVFQSGMDASGSARSARLHNEGEGSSITKLLGVGWTPKEREGGGLDGADAC